MFKTSKMSKTVNYMPDGTKYVSRLATDSLERNNTYVPGIDRVIFSLKTEKSVPGEAPGEKTTVPIDPILATTVMFNDGTRVTVKNSKLDPVETEKKKLSDGTTVDVATRRSKELAIVHAIVKRVVGRLDDDGEVDGIGYGRFLTEIVDGAYDQSYEQAEHKIQKAAKKKAYAEQKKTAKAKDKPRRYSFSDIAQLLGPILSDPAVVEKIKKTLGA